MTQAMSTVGDRQDATPYFSVIIPMYNRAHTIRRCLDSCLQQDFQDYEIIVVDDGSDEDDSVAVAESYTDQRIRVIKNADNLGVCAARGMGVKHARGQWLMLIDSDDSFNTGAFKTIYQQTQQVPEEVGEIRFSYWCEALGKTTPFPSLPLGITGFTDYLRWLEVVVNSDVFYCQRRAIYERVRWPTDRRFEMKFHLDVAAQFKILMADAVVGTMHDDAGNRITAAREKPFNPKGLQIAYDNALACQEILCTYGDALATHCPKRYQKLKRMVGGYYLRAGHRLKGAAGMIRYLSRRPFDAAGWGLLLFGFIGPRALHQAMRVGKRQG